MLKNGIFTISLDFELHWGVFPSKSVEAYAKNLEGTQHAIEKIINLFTNKQIHATWATVGLLFFDNKKEVEKWLPSLQVTYDNPQLNPYDFLATFPATYQGKSHFAKALIERIKHTPNQEIGTHTFSHFYCLEKGQTSEQFKADLQAAIEVGKLNNTDIKSIVFPRNQFNENYVNICKDLNINYLRSNPTNFLYKTRTKTAENHWLLRGLRLLDTYLNISGKQLGVPSTDNGIVRIPASRMFRPFHPKLKVLEPLKIKRIKKEMTAAAQQKKLYHLWWHPHNFGTNTAKNLSQLEEVLAHFLQLKNDYNFQSQNMQEIGAAYLDHKATKTPRQILVSA